MIGNEVEGNEKEAPDFELDRGKMNVALRLSKEDDEKAIMVNFYLTSGKKGRVKFNWSLSSDGRILWKKERMQKIAVEDVEDGSTGFIVDTLTNGTDFFRIRWKRGN